MEWQVVRPDQIPELGRKMAQWKAVVFDIETTGLDWFYEDVPIGIGLSPFEAEKYYYVPVTDLNEHDLRPILDWLETLPLIGHNIKFDLHNLALLGWEGVQQAFFDTIVMARIWAPEERPSLKLDELGKRIFDYDYPDEKVVRAVKGGRAHKLSAEQQALKCVPDVYLTKELYKFFKRTLSPKLLELFIKETRLTRDLYDMEARGIHIDQEFLEPAAARLDSELDELIVRITDVAGLKEFNPGSTPQKRALMEQLGIKPVKMAKKGPSWDRDALLAVRDQHPVALDLAKRQALAYQRNGLVERALKAVQYSGGFLHGEFKNWGTVTGRLSSNLQQLPAGWLQFGEAAETGDEVLVWLETAEAKEKEFAIRRLLSPRPGYVMIKADYSQIEMFVLGFYMGDPTFTRWLDSGNVHAAAADEVFGDPVKHYKKGKIYNFATVYGQGDEARAKLLNCSIEQSREYKNQYNEKMPGYQLILNRVRRLLNRDGYLENVYDRRYYIDPEFAYRGVNYICQGSAGDFVKFKLPETRELRKQIGLEMLITTHDDFIGEIPEENVKLLPEWLSELRTSPFGRSLELDAEYSFESLVTLSPLEELLNAA